MVLKTVNNNNNNNNNNDDDDDDDDGNNQATEIEPGFGPEEPLKLSLD